jgi:asparaginyl-tRNA synthetase
MASTSAASAVTDEKIAPSNTSTNAAAEPGAADSGAAKPGAAEAGAAAEAENAASSPPPPPPPAAAAKPLTKSAQKKAERLRQEKERKAAKEHELALRQKEDEEKRRAALEAAKSIVIEEDPSLPKARRIQIRDKDPQLIKLRPAKAPGVQKEEGGGTAAAGEEKEGEEEEKKKKEQRGTRVKVMGWVHRLRPQKGVIFLTLQDGTFSTLQCVLAGRLAQTHDALTLTLQTSIVVYGEMWEVPAKQHAPDNRELHADYFRVLGRAPGDREAYLTVIPPDADAQTRYNNRHLLIRGDHASAVLKVADLVLYGFHKTYFDLRFRQLRTPCMVQTQVEGGSTLFDFRYFDDHAYLTQSSQLYLETGLAAVGNNYCVMPSFRAEKSDTRRHLAEYTHIEGELGFIDFGDLLEHIEHLVVSVVDFVLAHPEGGRLVAELNPGFAPPARPFLRMTYAEAIAWLNEHGVMKEDGSAHVLGDDITEAAERRMTDTISRPIFLTYFPTELKAFYMKRKADDVRVTESADLLMPNVGELAGGSMRMDDLTELLAGYERQKIDPKPYYWYTDQRK